MATHGYNLYRRAPGVTAWTYVGRVDPGSTSIVAAHTAGVEYEYLLRAVSESGVESTVDTAVCSAVVSVEGVLVGPRPNPITSGVAIALAAGKTAVNLLYNPVGSPGVATHLQIARAVGENKTIDWSSPLATVAVGTGRVTHTLAGTFDDSETLHLAARAITGDDPFVAGEVYFMPPVAADSSPPMAIEYVEAVQV